MPVFFASTAKSPRRLPIVGGLRRIYRSLMLTDSLSPSSFCYEGKLQLQQPCTVRWPSGIFRLKALQAQIYAWGRCEGRLASAPDQLTTFQTAD